MTTEQIQQVTLLFKDNPTLKPDDVEIGLIFWEYAENEHILRWQIKEIKDMTLNLIWYFEPTVEKPEETTDPVLSLEEIVANTLWITLPTESVE